jgi:hypothetical protein
MSCICKKNIKSDEKCTHKSKPDSNYCGVHKQCKNEYKKPVSKKSPSKKSPSKKSPSKKSPSKKSSSKKSSSKKPVSEKPRCSCINSTSGERCKNNAKNDSKFCSVHKECKNSVKKSASKKSAVNKKAAKQKEDKEEEKNHLGTNIPGTSYTWKKLLDALKSSNKDDNIEAQWFNIKDKNMVLTLMRDCLSEMGKSDIINKNNDENIFFFIDFLQKFTKEYKTKIFNSLYNTFKENSEKFIENKDGKYLEDPTSPDMNIPIHAYLSLVGHFLYFYLTPKQKTIFANKYIDSVLKSYDYTFDSFPEIKKGFKFIFPDEGKLAIYQTLIVLYDVFFGELDESK